MNRAEVKASAPGNLLVAGEYAVLEGAPALAMAINRRAYATLEASSEPGAKPLSALHQAIKETLTNSAHAVEHLELDSDELAHLGQKLGLGSSSAACVAGIAALGADDTHRDVLYERSLDAHRRFQSGAGSGYDVAASVYGGVLIHERNAAPTRTNLPKGLHWRAFAWNRPAKSATFIEKWRRVKYKNPLLDAATRLCSLAEWDARTFLDQVCEFQRQLRAIDESASMGIWTREQPHLEAAAKALAKEHAAHLVFKQSGAGGGDVGIALSNSTAALQSFSTIAVQSGLSSLDVRLEHEGVTRK